MKLTVFDLDHTLINSNISLAFGQYLYREGIISKVDMLFLIGNYIRHKYFGMPQYKLHQKVLNWMFKKKTIGFYKDHVHEFLDNNFDRLVRPKVIERLKDAQAKGNYIVILSNSPDILVEAISKKFGVNHWKSTAYKFDENGRFTHIEHFGGVEKAEYTCDLARKLGFKKEDIIVYTDSILDLPLLNIAGKVIAVHPDKSLRCLCNKNKWKIIE